MTITRRTLLTSATTAGLLPMLTRRVWAGSTLTLGQMQIDTLSDGHLVLPGDFILGGMPQAEVQDILTRYALSTDRLEPPCNVTLLRDGAHTVLFDVGAGPDFMPTAGKLAEAMEALGLTADEVTHVAFTHGHPDHLWGLLDDFDEPVFANATYLMGQAEFDYWTDPATVDSIGAERQSFAVGAARRLEVLADSITLFGDGEEILPGIGTRLTPGHTPGHMAFQLGSGSESVMVVGDALGNHHVAFERPGWPSGSDQDAETAAATRGQLLDQITAAQMRLIGFHLPGGGIGHAERQGDSYRFVAEGA